MDKTTQKLDADPRLLVMSFVCLAVFVSCCLIVTFGLISMFS